MKKTILLAMMAVAMAATVSVQARTLDARAALQRAGEALEVQGPDRARAMQVASTLDPELTVSAAGEPAVYLFRQNDRYLIVSGDDCAPAVLGYGPAEGAEMAPAMRYWLDEYARQIEYARAHFAPAVEAKAPKADDKAPIAPLVKTLWNQSAPYNNDCPLVGTTRCVTGCAATALAQVMKYHNYPEKGTGEASYSWNGQTLSFNYDTEFDWANMLNVYTSAATDAQNAAVAKLMYACGVSLSMKYGTNASSATSVVIPQALVDYFGYDKGVRYTPRDYYGLEEWQDIVYNNLKDYGPMQYSGQSSDGGHSFVCDGYDKDGYFHINWGWGGMSDGYFLLTALTPASQGIGGSSSGYNYDQDIIAAVCPPKEGSKMYEQILATGSFVIAQTSASLGTAVSVNGGNDGGFYNYSAGELVAGRMGLKIEASNGDVTYAQGSDYQNLKLNYGFKSYSATLPTTLANGKYTVTPCFMTSTGDWRDVPVAISAVRSYEMTVDGNTATFAPSQTASVEVTEYTLDTPFYLGKDFKVTATLKNPTDEEFYGIVALAFLDPTSGSIIGFGVDYPVDIMGGEEQTIEYVSKVDRWAGTPTAGTYNVAIVDATTQTPLSELKEISLQAAPASTTISATAPVVENPQSVNSTALKVSTKLSCTAGYFTGSIRLVIFPYTSGTVSSLASFNSDAQFLSAGESKDVNFNVNFEGAEEGKSYFCAVYSGSNMMAQQQSPAYFTVTSTVTGVEGITVDEAPVAERFYNLQGVEVVRDNAAPGIYVRVRTYQDGHAVTDRVMVR